MNAAALTVAEAARILREATPEPRTWIYFVQAGRGGPIKIGSAKSPRDRIKALQIGSPTPLRVLGLYFAWPLEEKQLHEEFAADRLRGEWFRPSLALIRTAVALREGFWRDELLPPSEREAEA